MKIISSIWKYSGISENIQRQPFKDLRPVFLQFHRVSFSVSYMMSVASLVLDGPVGLAWNLWSDTVLPFTSPGIFMAFQSQYFYFF